MQNINLYYRAEEEKAGRGPIVHDSLPVEKIGTHPTGQSRLCIFQFQRIHSGNKTKSWIRGGKKILVPLHGGIGEGGVVGS